MSFTYSTQQFTSEVLDLANIESLDSEVSKSFFDDLNLIKPSIDEAFEDAGIQSQSITKDTERLFLKVTNDPEISALGLTQDEIRAIACYTFEPNGLKPLYKVINESLSVSRNSAGLSYTKKLIFLLLSGLRKLPRFKVSPGQMFYRGMNFKVPQNPFEAKGHQHYAEGNTVTWWGFTSTTTILKETNDFIKNAAQRTLLIIGGADLWGYDIKKFSKFPKEGEILLEPEAKVKVNSALQIDSCLLLNVELQPFNHLVLEDIIPVVRSISETPMERGQFSCMKNTTPVSQVKKVDPKENQGIDQKSVNSGSLPIKKASSPEIEKKWECVWKECPDDVDEVRKYSVDETNPRIATLTGDKYCTIIGNTSLPLNKVTLWDTKILKSKKNNEVKIDIGVAPFDINQDGVDNYKKCGWYLNCYYSTLCSGPPHNYKGKDYGPRMEKGEYVHIGDIVGVVMDTTKGELSFILNGVNHGVAYDEIPLDKPLVPCVLLGNKNDSVEFIISDVKESQIDSIPVPSNTTTKSANSGSLLFKKSSSPEVEKKWECIWKECPGYVNKDKYSVDENNPRIASKVDGNYHHCTIIGNTSLPPNKVTLWNFKILKTSSNGFGIYVGVAPFDINQKDSHDVYKKYGWYFNCHESSLFSGSPHRYYNKKYGPRKCGGGYIKSGDSVGVVMDMIKGDISFALDGVNLGVAYEGIPLNKPLVPCVLIEHEGDSVELIISEVKESQVDTSVPVPSNTTTKSVNSDSLLFKKSSSPDFSECAWKECPDYVEDRNKYSVDENNHRIAKKKWWLFWVFYHHRERISSAEQNCFMEHQNTEIKG